MQILSPGLLRDRDGSPREASRFVEPAHGLQASPELVQGLREGGSRAGGFADPDRALVQGHGCREVRLVASQAGKRREALGHLDVLPAEELLAQLERPRQERFRLLQEAQLDVHRTQKREHGRVDLGLPRELPVHARGAGVEQVLRRQLFSPGSARERALEEAAQERGDLKRLGGLALRAVPLLQRNGEPDRQRHRDEEPRGHADAVPPEELAGAVAEAVRRGAHRKPFEVPADVVGELLGRGVAARGLLAKRHEDDRVEIATPAEPSCSGAPAPGRERRR